MTGARILTAWDQPPDPLWGIAQAAASSGDAVCASCDGGIGPAEVAAMTVDGNFAGLSHFICTSCAPDRDRAVRLASAVSAEAGQG